MKTYRTEDLLEQHNSYDVSHDGRLQIGRHESSIVPGESPKWYCYWDGEEIHLRANEGNDVKGFDTAREALTYLQTGSAFRVLVKIGADVAPAREVAK